MCCLLRHSEVIEFNARVSHMTCVLDMTVKELGASNSYFDICQYVLKSSMENSSTSVVSDLIANFLKRKKKKTDKVKVSQKCVCGVKLSVDRSNLSIVNSFVDIQHIFDTICIEHLMRLCACVH